MAEKNADGLVVRYGLEQCPDIVLKAASDCQKAYVVDMKGPMKEMAVDLLIPAGTFIPYIALINDAAFNSSDAGTVTVDLVKAEDGSTVLKTLLDTAGYSALNTSTVIAPSSDIDPFVTPYDCIIKVTVANTFSEEGKARLVIGAVMTA